MPELKKRKHRSRLRWAVFLFGLAVFGIGVWQLLTHPKSPLPAEWNPVRPLQVNDPFTPLTPWKLSRALATRGACLAALKTGAVFDRLPDLEDREACHIRPQVVLRNAGAARVVPLKTRCQTALRLAMWEHHGIRPAAERHLKTELKEIKHLSSYNCRQMRTTDGSIPRMSTHATADAIDISGFVLADGNTLSLIKDWDKTGPRAAFLRDVRDSACEWFRVTLGPEYNALHADHFHLQHTGFGLCR